MKHLSTLQGWTTPQTRPKEALSAWQHSWSTLVATKVEHIIGFIRSITDGDITTYIAALLVQTEYQGEGIGRLLLKVCHSLFPHTRLDLITQEEAIPFYKAVGFRYVGEGLRKSN